MDALQAFRTQRRGMSPLTPTRDRVPMARLICRAAALATVLVVAVIAQPALAAKTVLNVGMAAIDAGRLDPHLSATTPDKALFNWMFNGLVRMKQGTMNPDAALIEGDLAESWKSSPDGKQWTFSLRKGVQCHHGYGEFTADDVVYSLARSADPKRSAFSSDFKDFDKVEAVDKYTVRISLKNQVPSLLGLLINYQGGNMVCKKAAEEMGEKFIQKPIGTGPFMFGEYKSKESVTLVANPQYFRGKPKLEKIVYRYILSDASRDLAFTSGEIDLEYGKQDQTWVDRMKKEKDTIVDVFDPGELSVLYLNVDKPPLNDLRVRQAIAYAIDRNQIVQFKGKDTARRRPVDRAHRLSRAERRRAAAAVRSREGEGAAQGSRLSERPHHQDHPHQPARDAVDDGSDPGAAAQGRHQPRHGSGRARDVPRQHPQGHESRSSTTAPPASRSPTST